MITTPTAIVVSTQKVSGNSWTRRSVQRVEQERPGREEQLVEHLERRVEGQQADDPERDRPDGDHASRQAEPPPEPGTRRPAAREQERRDEHDRADDREPVERREHAAHVAHVLRLALVEHRHAVERDVEVRRPDDEVGEDRVGRRPQVGLA